MARARNPNRDKAKRIWLESGGTKPLVDIAKELDVSDSQIRKWKSQDKWDAELNSNVTIEKERYHSGKGNSNAEGNKGNSRASPPPGNKNAVTHGLFAKWLPDETLEIAGQVNELKPADMLWDNILIQYTAIIRAQKIMYVVDASDMSDEIRKQSSGEGGSSTEWEIQYAWDKQANFLAAQSRAMGTLMNLIKQFVAITDEADERRLKLEMMQTQIDTLKGGGKNAEAVDWVALAQEIEEEEK